MKSMISLAKPLVERFPRVARLYRTVRDQLDADESPVETSWGFKMAGNRAMAHGNYEPLETELIRHILQEVDVLVNVGANVGYFCCHALSMGKQVIAFEPIQRNLRYLYQNIKENEWSSAEIYPIALSNRVGVIEIYGGNTGSSIIKGWAGGPESYATLVPSSTMDVVLTTRLKGKKVLILVDIEGAEKWMLEGATLMLANDPKPIWVVEITTREHQPRDVELNPNFASTFHLFSLNGYQAFIFDRDMLPVTMEQVDSASRGSLRFPTHNFLFRDSKVPV